jgi:hypothetical protein
VLSLNGSSRSLARQVGIAVSRSAGASTPDDRRRHCGPCCSGERHGDVAGLPLTMSLAHELVHIRRRDHQHAGRCRR